MKYFFKYKQVFIYLLIVSSFYARAQNIEKFREKDKILLLEKNSNAWKLNAVETKTGSNINIFYERLQFSLNPGIAYISGCVTTYFKVTSFGADTITLDLADTMRIDSVIFHSSKVVFSRSSDIVSLFLASSLPFNTVDSFSIYYGGTPFSTGMGTFVDTTHGLAHIPIIWTLSEPYGAKDWRPCKQGLTDKTDSIDIYITTPKPFVAVANGVLKETIDLGASRVFHWKHHYAIAPYLIGITITNYTTISQYIHLGNDSLLNINYVYPEDSASIATVVNELIPVMEFYCKNFGKYPFCQEQYGQVQFGWPGGMEHQTMTFLGGFGYYIMAHEAAHQWFGDAITCSSWKDIWLNEGFATYLTGLSYESLSPNLWWKKWKNDQIVDITSEPSGSVYVDDTTNIDRIFDGRLSYAKGASLLHMLRWKMGDSLFFSGIRNYMDDPHHRFNFATTNDFKSFMEQASGMNLSEFFADWFYGQGFPSYTIDYSRDLVNQVHVKISQTQSHNSVSFFEMPVPIEFKSGMRDTIIIFNNTYNNQQFTTNIDFAFDSVIVDPEKWIICNNNKVNFINEVEDIDKSFLAYPNPAHDMIDIIVPNSKGCIKEVLMIDHLGNQVRKIVPSGRIFKMSISLENISEGAFVIKVQTEKAVIKQKICKI